MIRPGESQMQIVRHSLRFVLSCVVLVTSANVAAAQTASGARLLVLLRNASALAIVDPASGKVLGRVPVGRDPHEVAVTPDGATAFVASSRRGHFDDRRARHEGDPAHRHRHRQRAARRALRRREAVLHRGRLQEHRPLRPGRKQGGLDARDRPGRHAPAGPCQGSADDVGAESRVQQHLGHRRVWREGRRGSRSRRFPCPG